MRLVEITVTNYMVIVTPSDLCPWATLENRYHTEKYTSNSIRYAAPIRNCTTKSSPLLVNYIFPLPMAV